MVNKDKDIVTLIAAGDLGPKREYPEEVFDLTRSILREADITLGQLEQTCSDRFPAPLQREGPNATARSRVSRVLADAGFNILTFASNHTMDWGEESVFDTLDVMKQNNIAVIGVGRNPEEARKPAIIERKGTKVGFLTYCSVMARGHEAGEKETGVSPIRVTTAYQISTGQPGQLPQRIITQANPGDLANMVDDIKKLRQEVDVLVVSQHWGLHFVTSPIAEYEYEVGHAAIDAGADIIIGTHAHTLKGIEVYRGKVIIHCLGNFNMDLPIAGPLADQMAKGYNVASIPSVAIDSHNRAMNIWGWKVDPDYPTHAFPNDCHKSILLKCDIFDKKIHRVAFIPCWLTAKGQPEPLPSSDPRSDEVLKYIEWLCEEERLYDTKFSREGNDIVILT